MPPGAGRARMAQRKWTGTWPGGRTFRARGKTKWVVERMADGVRFSRTLDVTSEVEAMAELALFDRDPHGYITAGEQAQEALAGALVVNADSIRQVQKHLQTLERHPGYVDAVVRYLAQWGEDLAAADLKKTRIETLKLVLTKHTTGRQKRIAALKTFTAYFREEVNTLPPELDPTVFLHAQKAPPAKLKKEKGYPVELIETFYAAISDWETEMTRPDRFGRIHPRAVVANGRRDGWGDAQGIRDLILMRAKFGMHGSEIDRLASGKAIIKVLKGQGEIAGTVRFVHKRQSDHIISVDAQGLAAAQRLHAHGGPISKSFLRTALRHAEKKAGLKERFLPGSLRHSFITIARGAGRVVKPKLGGVPLEEIQAVVGHAPGSTVTRQHYLGDHVPSMIVIPLKLEHPDDPRGALRLKVVGAVS
jgi:integrase